MYNCTWVRARGGGRRGARFVRRRRRGFVLWVGLWLAGSGGGLFRFFLRCSLLPRRSCGRRRGLVFCVVSCPWDDARVVSRGWGGRPPACEERDDARWRGRAGGWAAPMYLSAAVHYVPLRRATATRRRSRCSAPRCRATAGARRSPRRAPRVHSLRSPRDAPPPRPTDTPPRRTNAPPRAPVTRRGVGGARW